QSNRRISNVVMSLKTGLTISTLSYILYMLLLNARKPDKQDAFLIENLFHPEILVSQDDFLRQVLTLDTSILTNPNCQDSAFIWWLKLLVGNQFKYEDMAYLINFVKHPVFKYARFSVPALQALQARQSANIALSAKLNEADCRQLMEILD